MASTTVSRIVPATPEKVWTLVGGFDALPDWLPFVPESVAVEGGRVRRLATPDGDVIVERLVDFNETERRYSYTILQAPFPVDGYVATIRVHAVPGRDDLAEVQWSGRFNPVDATEQEVVDLFTGIYADGLDALHRTFAG
ncbi:SRPBCC family protein [Kitasatospora purpeofusca]|uniref:SRPBCC family protein n=1 Tax=Kitasatospora purpeofusca TaxID=67352 RepID=UPI0036D2C53D